MVPPRELGFKLGDFALGFSQWDLLAFDMSGRTARVDHSVKAEMAELVVESALGVVRTASSWSSNFIYILLERSFDGVKGRPGCFDVGFFVTMLCGVL